MGTIGVMFKYGARGRIFQRYSSKRILYDSAHIIPLSSARRLHNRNDWTIFFESTKVMSW